MQIPLGDFGMTVEVRDELLVPGRRSPVAPNLPDLAAAVRAALDQPHNFPALRRALTPGDRIAVVVDERLPQLGALVTQVIEYITESGVDAGAITLVSAPGSRQLWVDQLPDSVQDVRTEIHDPTNRQAFSYLATTRKGRRIYLNRTVVEADQSMILAGCRYDPLLGRHNGAGSVFPALSDADTRRDAAALAVTDLPDAAGSPLHAEATEVAWLLGVPFMLQIVEGEGDGIAHVVAGTAESIGECERLLDERWRVTFTRPGQTVVATVTGDPARQDFETLSRAALTASRVAEAGGRVILLTRARPDLGEAAQLLRGTDNLSVAARRIQEHRPPDSVAALQWLAAARHASLYLLSELPEETVEEMFATPLQQARQAQRLLDAAESCLFLDDAHKALGVIQ